MKALVLKRPRDLCLMDVPRPELTEEDQVLVQVDWCGICGSDLRYWAGDNPWASHTLGKAAKNPPNIIMGHEFVGWVVEVRSDKYEALIGQRVAVQPFRVCGECPFCRTGRQNLCPRTIHLGHAQGWPVMPFYPGAYAEYCVAWGDLVFPVPADTPSENAAMMDLFCVAVHAVKRTQWRPGATVLCIGGGPVGSAIAQVAKAYRAGPVIVSDPSPIAQQVLAAFDQITVVNPDREQVRGVLNARLGMETVDLVFDTVGSAQALDLALSLLGPSGAYVNLAIQNTQIEACLQAFGAERIVTSSSNAVYSDVREAFDLICSKKVNPGPMITHRFSLDEHQEAFDLLLSSPKKGYKILLSANHRSDC